MRGQLQVLSTCSAVAGVCFRLAQMMGKEQRCLRKDEGERGAMVKASWISCGHPGDPAFGRGSTSSLKKEKGLSDALLRCGPRLGCIPVLENCPCFLLLLQTFFLEGASLLRASINPFLALLSPYGVILPCIFSCYFSL